MKHYLNIISINKFEETTIFI